MSRLTSLVDYISRVMLNIAGFMIAAMMFVVLIDVATRTLFGLSGGTINLTFNGGIELVRYALLFGILYALPWNIERSQVVVDLFTTNLSDRKILFLEAIGYLGYFFLALIMSYRFWGSIELVQMTGETTQDLRIPLTYIYAATLVGTSMLSIRALIVACKKLLAALGYKS